MKRNLLLAMALMSVMTASVATAQTTTTQSKPAVLKVNRSRTEVSVVTNADTTVYTRKRNADVSFATKQAFVNGEANAFDNENKDAEGNKLSRPFVGIGGGGQYVFDGTEIRPAFRATLGWEKKYFLTFVNFDMSWKGFNTSTNLTANGVTEGAEATGHYTTFNATLGFAGKVWQDARYRSFIALYGDAGYGYCKTDGDNENIRFTSSFYGFVWEGGIKAKWGFSRHLGLNVDLGVGNVARNFHDSEQDMGAIALKGVLSLVYTF